MLQNQMVNVADLSSKTNSDDMSATATGTAAATDVAANSSNININKPLAGQDASLGRQVHTTFIQPRQSTIQNLDNIAYFPPKQIFVNLAISITSLRNHHHGAYRLTLTTQHALIISENIIFQVGNEEFIVRSHTKDIGT